MDALLERKLRDKTREKQEVFPELGQQFIQELYQSKSVATVFEYTKDIAIFFDYLMDRMHARSLVDADFSRCDLALYHDFIHALRKWHLEQKSKSRNPEELGAFPLQGRHRDGRCLQQHRNGLFGC